MGHVLRVLRGCVCLHTNTHNPPPQGAELMSQFGINVPPGQAAQSMDEVKRAADAMKDENNEVCVCAVLGQLTLQDAPHASQPLLCPRQRWKGL